MKNEQHSSGKTEHGHYEIAECDIELVANILGTIRMLCKDKNQ